MKMIERSSKALSAPVTSMILLVVPVMLAGGVIMYAYQLMEMRINVEVLRLSNQHIWVYDNGTSFAAFVIENLGGRDIVIDKIYVRGVEVPWSTIYYFRNSSSISTELNCPNSTHSWSSFEYTKGKVASFSVADGEITLASGCTLIIFIENPDNISPNDVGTNVSIVIFTENGQYYIECIVKTAEAT
ncbi:MAG TPA: hypothetical protein ENF85_02500 [Candidatus Bathyarchaeota archaeon]|nr:hypothetical protein [Candidatus Bathyarchaeota archaeon]